MDTAVVKKIYIDQNETDYLSNPYLEYLSKLIPAIEKLMQGRWVFMENEQVFYDTEVVALYPDLNYYKCLNTSNNSICLLNEKILNFSGHIGDFMTLDEQTKSFDKNISFPFKVFPHHIKYDGTNHHYRIGYKKDAATLGGHDMDDNSIHAEPGVIIPIFRLNGENSCTVNSNKTLMLWLQYGLIPRDLDNETKNIYKGIMNVADYLIYQNNKIGFDKDFLMEIAKTNTAKIKYDSKNLYEKLLNCEKYRADIECYNENILTDLNRGHWDLWDQAPRGSSVLIEIERELVARNPRVDIKTSGVIAIDFGTKSTVVVHQEDSEHTLPMRVGVGHFSKKVEGKHYENPTVIEFINLERFLLKYKAKIGRPDTLWEDLTVSHTALSNLMKSSSENYYTILSDLKQWAGNKQRQIRLKDKQGKDIILPAFLELDENQVNPIELYAYYIGLYINNQHTGIYLDYTLSFPVTYEKKVREKILESFSKGLKKSLPPSLHRDEEVMSQFRVLSGASEPAAYAICALQEYGFEPAEDEKVFYGVFDFGGGTTDFDFGIWREADRQERRRYDYVLEEFGAGGDRYLGGENLLELLAFKVFKANQDKLREAGICFILPPECKKFVGSEVLVSDSQEAKLNTKQVMEKIRPLWEKHENYAKEFEKGTIKVNLFDKGGQQKLNFELNMNREILEKIVESRIEKGIRNFFEALGRSFEEMKVQDFEKINIFLAGNSSKAEIVAAIFNRHIVDQKQNFEIFPPLGTEEAYGKQQEKGVASEKDSIVKPTGKTGVAFGLLKSRKGGKIKIIDRNIVEDDEVKFKYFIGENRKGCFKVVVDREAGYRIWHNFIDATEEDFEIYYTDLPEAGNGKMKIQEIERRKCRIDVTDEEAAVFIRTASPTMIEYVVATEEGIKKGIYLNEIKQIELN
jgi:hypothetical protein